MNIRERQLSYKTAVTKTDAATKKTRFADAFGVSNSAKVIERGLFACNVNFNAFAVDADQLVIHCLLRFPPDDEVYFSLYVRNGLTTFRERLEEMRLAGVSKSRKSSKDDDDEGDEDDEEGDVDAASAAISSAAAASPDELSYTNNNKNVKGYIALDGKLYLRNKSYWDSMPEDLSSISRPVPIDQVVFSIWPPAASARRSLLARQFVGYIGNLIGREKVHELKVWDEAGSVSAEMRRMPASIPIAELESSVTALGGHYPGGEVRRFHAALSFLQHKHFVILAGLSGTGKTQLALKYARAVHGVKTMREVDPFLFVCPVRPEWTDPTGLTGYFDVLSNRYMVPPFLEAVLLATAHRDSPVFVVLDEMNLARVEYYFSDVLSAVETGEALQLHSSGVPLEGSTGTTVPAMLPLPENLFIIGTINIDETTNSVSDKVLDRAMIIDMSAVDLPGFLADLEARDAALKDARAVCEERLLAAQALMQPHNLGFGYRVAEEVVRYHAFATAALAQDPDSTVDELMVQKVLVKLRGAEKQRQMLNGLQKALPLPRSEAYIARLLSDLDEFGSFQASR
ncbi:AAA+ ATPase domain-containing protein [Methylorubrum populi]